MLSNVIEMTFNFSFIEKIKEQVYRVDMRRRATRPEQSVDHRQGMKTLASIAITK